MSTRSVSSWSDCPVDYIDTAAWNLWHHLLNRVWNFEQLSPLTKSLLQFDAHNASYQCVELTRWQNPNYRTDAPSASAPIV